MSSMSYSQVGPRITIRITVLAMLLTVGLLMVSGEVAYKGVIRPAYRLAKEVISFEQWLTDIVWLIVGMAQLGHYLPKPPDVLKQLHSHTYYLSMVTGLIGWTLISFGWQYGVGGFLAGIGVTVASLKSYSSLH